MTLIWMYIKMLLSLVILYRKQFFWPHWSNTLIQLIHSNRKEHKEVENSLIQDDDLAKLDSSANILSSNTSKLRPSNPLSLSSHLISNQMIINDLVLVILLLRNKFKMSWSDWRLNSLSRYFISGNALIWSLEAL